MKEDSIRMRVMSGETDTNIDSSCSQARLYGLILRDIFLSTRFWHLHKHTINDTYDQGVKLSIAPWVKDQEFDNTLEDRKIKTENLYADWSHSD